LRGTFYQTDAHSQIFKERETSIESPSIARVQLTDELESKLASRTHFAVVSPNPLVEQAGKWFDLSSQ